MPLQIDDAFIGKWHPKYDEIEGDECEYKELVELVRTASGSISKDAFRRIWIWKGAMRVIRFTRIYVKGYRTQADAPELDEYDARYAPAFRRAANAPPERKLSALLGAPGKLPGLAAPTASTIIHFIHPETMPIIDVRTVEVLHEAQRISTKQRDLEHYEEFRKAIDTIRCDCPNFTLRQIDRALFAYHKLHKLVVPCTIGPALPRDRIQ
ncbi:MAG: hypothetical protein ACRD27_04590 [Terracidiphilus sp.]